MAAFQDRAIASPTNIQQRMLPNSIPIQGQNRNEQPQNRLKVGTQKESAVYQATFRPKSTAKSSTVAEPVSKIQEKAATAKVMKAATSLRTDTVPNAKPPDISKNTSRLPLLHAPVCPLTKTPPQKAYPLLTTCRQYEELSCCNAETATRARKPFTQAHPYAMCPGCVHNLAALQCAIHCSPHQGNFVVSSEKTILSKTSKNISSSPMVRLCDSFCLSLFRSCGDVIFSGEQNRVGQIYRSTRRRIHGEKLFGSNKDRSEIWAAREFCLDQFRAHGHFHVEVVDDRADEKCFGQNLAAFSDCDPFESERFWHVMDKSMQFKHGLGLALVSLMLLGAAACVGYAMTVARRRAEWINEKMIQEFDGGSHKRVGHARDDGDAAETDTLLNYQTSDSPQSGKAL